MNNPSPRPEETPRDRHQHTQRRISPNHHRFILRTPSPNRPPTPPQQHEQRITDPSLVRPLPPIRPPHPPNLHSIPVLRLHIPRFPIMATPHRRHRHRRPPILRNLPRDIRKQPRADDIVRMEEVVEQDHRWQREFHFQGLTARGASLSWESRI